MLLTSCIVNPLQDLVPTRARIALKDGQHREVPADAISPGDLLAVLPGVYCCCCLLQIWTCVYVTREVLAGAIGPGGLLALLPGACCEI